MTFTLPSTLRLFPLNGAVLLPGEILPLNIFEPRYLNMVDDARAGDGLVGMIQTRPGGAPEHPELRSVGCAGRISRFQETPDGRYLIELEGVCRFTLVSELDENQPYRSARIDFSRYSADCGAPDALLTVDRSRLTELLRLWFTREHIETDWDAVDAAPISRLINRMTMVAPFLPDERQNLLETEDTRKRLICMSRILEQRIAQSASGNPN